MATEGLLIGAGLLGLGGLIRFLSHETELARTEFDIGPESEYPNPSRTVLAQIPAVLIHENSTFTAYSLVCTHLGCTAESDGQEFACPCHGSRFDKDGALLKGPASRALKEMRVTLSLS
jgi:cytochrome b6-f complex iron-sulfur subunit